jgi:hypothetical protein
MPDKLFFKQVSATQWLGLRVPAGVEMKAGAQGQVGQPAAVSYDPATALPTGIDAVSFLTIVPGAAGPGTKLVVQAPPLALGMPFANALAYIGSATDPDAEGLRAEIARLSVAPSLPLHLYWAYRNARYGTVDLTQEAGLAALYGKNGSKFRLESFSQLLFVVTCAPGAHPEANPAAGIHVDLPALAGTQPLTLGATQLVQGVQLRLRDEMTTISNRNIFDLICPGDDPVRHLGCSYQWIRTLGLAERSAASSGPVFIPAPAPQPQPELAPGEIAAALVADLPFAIVDPLAASELVGELLNYEVQLFNPHGRCTHQGRIILKRQRLDRPAPPADPVMVLRRPSGSGADVECLLRCTIDEAHVAEMKSGTKFELVLYRHDFPVVPTGFYGDEDDQSLLVARRMADLEPVLFNQAEFGAPGAQAEAAAGADINLSNHNLKLVMGLMAKPQSAQEQTLTLPFDTGAATQFFVAIRRVLAPEAGGRDGMTESVVTAATHGLDLDAHEGPTAAAPAAEPEPPRMVPHFEAYWRAPATAHAPLGDAQARVIEVAGLAAAPEQTATPPHVTVLVQHKRSGTDDNGALIGGYRLWVRELLGAASGEAFVPVALVQALPPLVKAYAPLESGRRWLRVKPSQAGGIETPPLQKMDLPKMDFFIAQAVMTEGVPESTKEELRQAVAKTERELAARGLQTGGFNAAATEASAALDTSTPNIGALLAPLRRHDEPGLADERTLKTLLALKDAGLAQEIILSVRKRQRLQQQDMSGFPGHWLFFQDQNGTFLGRAFHFWAPVGTDAGTTAGINRFYALREAPSAQDAVGMDDFGRVAWSWDGIRDFWRHELEWLVEPVGRYEPLLGKRADLGKGEALPDHGAGQVHRLSIQRSAPLQAKFSLVQALPAAPGAPDAFVVRLIAPADFRQALHNTVARTRLGVLRVVPGIAARVLTDQLAFAIDPAAPHGPRALDFISACLDGSAAANDEPAPALRNEALLDDAGTYGELVIDEPACIRLGVSVQAMADGVGGPLLRLDDMQRAPLRAAMPDDKKPTIVPFGVGRRIAVPVARLAWSYTGARRPAIGPYIDGAGIGPLEHFKDAFGGNSLLDLPDPYAEFILYLRQNGIATPVLHFCGASARLAQSSGFAGLAQEPLAWGRLWRDPARIQAAGFEESNLVLTVLATPTDYFYQWRIQGASTTMQALTEGP